jgi:SAM-dependent methyltransferase
VSQQGPTGPADDPVAEQYEKWVYPAPLPDLAAVPLASPQWRFKDLRELYWAYWPSAPYREDLDVLVAGCGTIAAACYAYLYPQTRVVGIDVSAASLAHEDLLRQKHQLGNLTLCQCRVEDAVTLGRTFDFIVCHGVLHHLVDPAAGLRVLGGLLNPDGVIDIMVYGTYGRIGVSMLQGLFRLLGLEQTPAGVQAVREALTALPPSHPVQRYLRLALDLGEDTGLVDTFLHVRERTFSAAECLDLISEAGLVFQGWDENGLYFPDAHLPVDHPLRSRLERLPPRALYHAVELLYGNTPGHWFYACRPDRPAGSYTVQFEDEAFLDYIPLSRVTQVTPADALGQQPRTIARPPFPPIPLAPWAAALYLSIDGQRTVRQCLATLGADPSQTAVLQAARQFFRSLWRLGYVLCRLP